MSNCRGAFPPFVYTTLIGKATLYAKNHWSQLTVFIEDGRLEIDNNRIENMIRPVALGRKNWLFAGSQARAERAAILYSIFGTCKIHRINPFEYLKDILEQVNTHPASKIDELLPIQIGKATQPVVHRTDT